jgi:prepilin peptidase CpaA
LRQDFEPDQPFETNGVGARFLFVEVFVEGFISGGSRGAMITSIFIITVFPAGMVLAAATDLLTMTVPNRVVLLLLVGFAVLAPLIGLSWSDVGIRVILASAALVATFVMFSFGWIGGGDAKLFAATCLWLGPQGLLSYSLYVALLGGILTLVLLLWRKVPLPAALISQEWLARLHRPKEGVPYGIALSAAGLIVYPNTPFVAALGG